MRGGRAQAHAAISFRHRNNRSCPLTATDFDQDALLLKAVQLTSNDLLEGKRHRPSFTKYWLGILTEPEGSLEMTHGSQLLVEDPWVALQQHLYSVSSCIQGGQPNGLPIQSDVLQPITSKKVWSISCHHQQRKFLYLQSILDLGPPSDQQPSLAHPCRSSEGWWKASKRLQETPSSTSLPK